MAYTIQETNMSFFQMIISKLAKHYGLSKAMERLDEIAAHGVVFTPGLVIDGNVVSAGKLPKAAQIVAWIRGAK